MQTRHSDSASNHAPRADTCWAAVLQRDRRYDGTFVYGVSSTLVYCRPSCPARRPRRDRVQFFTAPELAEQAGYRACRRCSPREPGAVGAELRLQAVRSFLDENPGENLSLKTLAVRFGWNPQHLQRSFSARFGLSPKAYVDALRTERFRHEVRAGTAVGPALYAAGFGSSRALYERAPARLGMTPARYRRGGAGVVITYGIARCSLGRLLVATSERGVCAVLLGDRQVELERELGREFYASRLERDDRALEPVVSAIASLADAEVPSPAPPLDLSGTEFQRRVWAALQRIPRGETRSYQALARALGRPTAARAVGRACAGNRLALVIPCHRVTHSDGELGGYRWGLARKRRLLSREGRAAEAITPSKQRR